jgi:hypothetical protein
VLAARFAENESFPNSPAAEVAVPVFYCPTCARPIELPPGTLGMKTECAACRDAGNRRAPLTPIAPAPAPPEPTSAAQPPTRSKALFVGIGAMFLLIGAVLLVLVIAGSGGKPARALPVNEGPAAARRAAMERYGAWPYKDRTLRRWARMFRGPAADREEAMLALMEAGKPAVPFLVDLMTAPNVATRADAAVALATMARGGRYHNSEWIKPCPEALAALLAGVEDPEPLIRLHAVVVLDTHQVDGGRATPALRKVAEDDPDPTAREAARRALQRRGG